jgi:hypothetical protein
LQADFLDQPDLNALNLDRRAHIQPIQGGIRKRPPIQSWA